MNHNPPLPVRADGTIATEPVERLLARVSVLAAETGRMITPLPQLSFFRSDVPIAHVRGHSPVLNLAVATSGSKQIRIGPHVQTNDARRYLVMHGGRHYDASVAADADDPYVALKLQLPPETVGHVLVELAEAGGLGPASFDEPPPVFVGSVDPRLADALCRLLDCLDDPSEQRFLAPAIIGEIAFRLLRSDAASLLRASITREHLRLLQAMRFIESNLDGGLTVQAIAQSVAMSPSHFAHRFRALTGVSPIQHVKSLRLDKARRLLLDDGCTVDKAAFEAGYASVSHFSRDFRRQFGVSPARYPGTFRQRLVVGIDG